MRFRRVKEGVCAGLGLPERRGLAVTSNHDGVAHVGTNPAARADARGQALALVCAHEGRPADGPTTQRTPGCVGFERWLSPARRRAIVPTAMRPASYPGPRRSIFGMLMAVLALLGHVAFGSAVPAQAAPGILGLSASPFGDIPICRSGAPDPADNGAPTGHTHHGTQCALCPACHVLAAAAVLPVPTPTVAPPLAAPAGRRPLLPPARGPPATVVLAATYPTGPPRLAGPDARAAAVPPCTAALLQLPGP